LKESEMTWQVAIPSYKRPTGLKKHTLHTLREGGVPADRIRVFVASQEERDEYESALDFGTYREIVVAAKGLHCARNFINRFYPDGSLLVEVDDDVRGVFSAASEKELSLVPDLGALFTDLFKKASACGARLWGMYPVCNPMWMHGAAPTSALKPIIGTLFGRVVDHSLPDILLEIKEDFERTLLYWEKDRAVYRINDVSPRQNPRGGTGGLQTPDGRTLEKSELAAVSLISRWPALVKRGRTFKDGHAEVKLVAPKG
jgi:hypothetical protein